MCVWGGGGGHEFAGISPVHQNILMPIYKLGDIRARTYKSTHTHTIYLWMDGWMDGWMDNTRCSFSLNMVNFSMFLNFNIKTKQERKEERKKRIFLIITDK